jgi:hypothetical protein
VFCYQFTFWDKVWVYSGQGSWHFVTVPADISKEIKNGYPFTTKNFGSVPVEVTIGITTWKTLLFRDSKTGCYFLPIKAAV